MSAVPTARPTRPRSSHARRPAGSRPTPGAEQGASSLPTLFMLAFLVYFLMPLTWLFIASTKSVDDLFNSFGLWFAHFNLIENISDTFAKDDGIYGTWLRNTLMYSTVSAIGAALLAAMAGYGFAKFAFRGKEALFWIVLGSVMVPHDRAGDPDLPDVQQDRAHEQPAVGSSCPSLVSPFGIYLMRIYAESSVPERSDGGGADRRRGRVQDLPPDRVPAAGARLRHGAAVHVRRDVEQLLPAARAVLRAQVVPAHRRASRSGTARPTASGGSTAAFNLVITGSLISVVPLIIAFIFLQRYWQSGLGAGGVKG